MKKNDYSTYILPIGGLVLLYFVLQRFGLVKDTVKQQTESEQLFKNYFSPTYLQQLMKQGGRTALMTQNDVARQVKDLYDSKGIFNDDETKLYGAIKRFKYKSQISQVADAFNKKYNKDLAFYLNSFLNESELSRVYDFTDNLPSGKV